MSLWLGILKAAGQGHSRQARDLLSELTISLRYPRLGRSYGDCAYDGPLARAVLHAINDFQGSDERSLALNRTEDLIDHIIEIIGMKILRTIELIEYCLQNPDKDIASVAKNSPSLRRLKRSTDGLREYVCVRLHSMVIAGVDFKSRSVAVGQAILEDISSDKILRFNEIALVKSLNIKEVWNKFLEKERLTYEHESYDLLCESSFGESANFGAISDRLTTFSLVHDLEFQQLTEEISKVLNNTLDELQNEKPFHGFGPIAWHRVWWEYDQDCYLNLKRSQPECLTDELLSECISSNYPEVRNMNRLIAHRRRTKLESLCRERISRIYQANREVRY